MTQKHTRSMTMATSIFGFELLDSFDGLFFESPPPPPTAAAAAAVVVVVAADVVVAVVFVGSEFEFSVDIFFSFITTFVVQFIYIMVA